MAQLGVQLYRETFSCSICLDLLKDPVTVPCGHSYCKDCIKTHWDAEDHSGLSSNSCPQCRQTFDTRPVLVKNTMLADLVEELKKTGVQAAPADHCYAGPEDVACDFCTGRKLKAFKSCLVCVASYCEKHLQPHYELPVFEKHKLVEPSKKLQENLCHDTVSAAAERTERQRELEGSRLNIQQRITDVEKDVKLLQQEVEAINGSADKAVEHSEKTFAQMIQQVRSKQKTEVSRVRDLQEKLEQEIAELKRRDAELKTLAHHEDHNQFLHDYRSLPALSESTHSSSINIRPLRYFEDVTAAVSEAREKLQDVLKETWTNISWTNISLTETPVDVSLPQPEPKTRADFLRYSRDITLYPNTAYTWLLLSKGNRKVTFMTKSQSYPNHPDRFTNWPQVLSKESLTGCCYWEVKWRGPAVLREGGVVNIAVSYKNISRACSSSNSNEAGFGLNDKSWALECFPDSYCFSHENVRTPVSGPLSSRIGVYLDHSAGVLSFYSVSRTMTLLHRVQTTFTQPLHAGVHLWENGDSAEFSKLK